jgi:DNA-binding CsgD family transcriptional regulator
MLARAKLKEQLALLEIAVGGDTVIIVDKIGAVRFITDRAEQVLRDYFSGMEEGLPRELRVWLKSNPPTGARLVRKRPGRELVCICGNSMPLPGSALEAILRDSPCPTNARCVRLTETFQNTLDWIPFPTPDQIQQVGFTPRESEILFWVIQGKRDSEIAKILSEKREVSLRTINNHLSNILAKTNAETRTGACLEALDRIKRHSEFDTKEEGHR